jgi:hypothetical protein
VRRRRYCTSRAARNADAAIMTSALRSLSPFVDAVFSGARRTYSSQRWLARQTKDIYTKQAKVLGLKSRAAFKLLEINDDYHIFKKGDTVVDLVYLLKIPTAAAISADLNVGLCAWIMEPSSPSPATPNHSETGLTLEA